MRRRKASPPVATPEEVWAGIKSGLWGAPRALVENLFSLDTYFFIAAMLAVSAIYIVGTALLFSYLPARLFGATEGSWGWDLLLGLLLGTMGWLYLQGKYVQPRQERAERRRRLRVLRAELGPRRERVREMVVRRGQNHPETGYAYRELGKNLEALGQREQARQVHLQEREIFRETLGVASPEANYWKKLDLDPPVIKPKLEVVQASRTACGEMEVFDTRRTLISIFGILLGVSVMSAVIIGIAYGIELIISIFR